jgi:hypothetical protein
MKITRSLWNISFGVEGSSLALEIMSPALKDKVLRLKGSLDAACQYLDLIVGERSLVFLVP